ncbi:ribonuclease T2 [Trifolium repens]|jgi:hypothetical protein|nr:ribonuclease T2 [Trifolium repens]
MGLYEILKLEGIVPGASQTKPATYPQNKFIEAIKKHHFMDQVTIIPQFYCNKGTVLKEKRMCLDNNGFDYMNCTSTIGTGTRCGQQIQWYT